MAWSNLTNHTATTHASFNAGDEVLTLAGNVPAGACIFVWNVFDNLTATTPTIASLSVPGGETADWRRLGFFDSPNASANAGCRGELWGIQTTQQWDSAYAILATPSASTGKIAAVGFSAEGGSLTVRGSGSGTSTGGTPSASTAAPASGDLVIGGAGWETSAAATADSDTTNGSWSAADTVNTTGGSATANVRAMLQTKLPSAAGTQTYNPADASDSGAVIVSLVPSYAGPQILSVTESTRDNTSPKNAIVTGCRTGDVLYVHAGGDANTGAAVTAAAVSTLNGSTGTWSELGKSLSSAPEDWLAAWKATVTADGNVTVEVSRTQGGTAGAWHFWVARIKTGTSGGEDVVTKFTANTTQVINTAIAADSLVTFASYEWDAVAPGTFTPAGAIEVERSSDGVYSEASALWLAQAAGTRDYGTTGSSGTKFKAILVEILVPAAATNLVIANAAQAQTVDAPSLKQVHSLAVNGAVQAHSVQNVTLTQQHQLVVQNASQGQIADSPTLAVPTVLVIADAMQAQAAQAVALTQQHNLAVAGASQAQPVGSLALTQVHNLATQNAFQAQAADNISLSGATELTIANATQAQTVGGVTLTQIHALAVQASTHAQTAANLDLSGAANLVTANAIQGHTAGNVTLTQVHGLTVANAAQAHTVQGVALTQLHQLTVQGAAHAQTAAAPTLSTTLAVQNATQGHTASMVGLTQQHFLAVNLGAHTQTAQQFALTQLHLLAVNAATQGQTADNIDLPPEQTAGAISQASMAVPGTIGGTKPVPDTTGARLLTATMTGG